jgi:hypothetical protein
MLVGVMWQKPTGTTVGVEHVPSLCSQQLHCGSGTFDHQLVINKMRRSRNLAIEKVYETFEEQLLGFEAETIEQIFQDQFKTLLIIFSIYKKVNRSNFILRKPFVES